MRHYFYNDVTGILTGATYQGDPAFLAINTPSGHSPIQGVTDHLSQRIDPVTKAIVDWQPPMPAADDLKTWSWDAATKRWVLVKTTKALAKEVRTQRDAYLTACDWVVVQATEAGTKVAADWLAYRNALRDVPKQAGFPDNVTWPTSP